MTNIHFLTDFEITNYLEFTDLNYLNSTILTSNLLFFPNQPKVPPKKSETVPVSAPVNFGYDSSAAHATGQRLRNLLKLPKAHKWVCYEWFYSNIDA